MNNYFRITGYCPKKNYCFILDSYGMFEKLWQFSSYLVQIGYKVLEVSNADNFIDINIEKVEVNPEKVFLRASSTGLPEKISQKIDGIVYEAIKVADKIYIPKK